MNPKYKTLTALLFSINALMLPLMDVAADEQELKQETLNLKHKVERLEKSRIPVPMKKELAEKNKQDGIFDKFIVTGLIEVEASYVDQADEIDIALATAELGIDAQVTPWVNGHILFLYEDGMDSPEVDEAMITIANEDERPWSLAAGRMYIPFGNYDSNMISDPLTLEIGETREEAVQLGYVSGNFYSLVFAYNGSTGTAANSAIDQFGFNLGLSHEQTDKHLGYSSGVSWINNLADSDSIQAVITDPGNLHKKVPGISAYAKLNTGSWIFIAEYLAALESFDAADLAFSTQGAKPQSYNLEAAYQFDLAGKASLVGVAWQQSKQALALDLPEIRYLATMSVEIYKYSSLSLEYAHDEDYAVSGGGSGENNDVFTAQLAVVF